MTTLPLLLAVCGATRPTFGGEVVAYVFGAPISTHPRDQATSADATLQRAIYEPLYRFVGQDIVPNLARELPAADGARVRVVLRPNLSAHDGTPIDAREVAEWLSTFVSKESRAAFLFLSIRGARARISERASELGIFAVDRDTLIFELDHPYPAFGRLLASAHAGVASAGGAGTGPFQVGSASGGGVLLAPFLEHPGGRPFLDRVELRPMTSRFGASSVIKNVRAALVFGVPDDHRIERTSFDRHGEVIVLSFGDRFIAPDRGKVIAAADGALNRRRLLERYLGKDAKEASTFLGIRAEALGSGTAEARATMLVSKEARAGQRFAERVQLDLHRAGITTVIERVAPEDLERRRRSRDYELMLDVALPDLPADPLPIDRFHGLLSIASSYGRPDFIDAADTERFVTADRAAQDALLPSIETLLRARVGLLPIAARTLDVSVQPTIDGVEIDATGALELDDAVVSASRSLE
jgi:ABC-type transport system substrate-binding protein